MEGVRRHSAAAAWFGVSPSRRAGWHQPPPVDGPSEGLHRWQFSPSGSPGEVMGRVGSVLSLHRWRMRILRRFSTPSCPRRHWNGRGLRGGRLTR
eukprot:540202-Alexandrium_andersonii.AAC.1